MLSNSVKLNEKGAMSTLAMTSDFLNASDIQLKSRVTQNELQPIPTDLDVRMADSDELLSAAQRLRYEVFAEELGAMIGNAGARTESDLFDRYCEHIVVIDHSPPRGAKVVGTYRVVSPEVAALIGCYGSETEFDISSLTTIRGSLAEVGRACIHPDYRSGSVILMLWSAVTKWAIERRYQYLMGCASVNLADGGSAACAISEQLNAAPNIPDSFQVTPKLPFTMVGKQRPEDRPARLPPLLKGYLRLGAWVYGQPAWDPQFNTADFFVLLPMDRMKAKYARHLARPAIAQI
jgi:putative hemolysin